MMPAYNAEAYIEQAIDSVLAQSYSLWELVIVDDGSTDHTGEIVGRYADPRIKLVVQSNGGEASARNTALKNSQGEFIAFLDADDLYLPHHLQSSVGYLLEHNQADGIYADGYYVDQNRNCLQTLSSRRRGPFEGYIFEEVVRGSDVFGPPLCVVVRSGLIHRYELKLDENIIIGPDWDFLTRFAEVGAFAYLDQITCLYRLHTSNISLRVGLEKRALELAKCRINAIKLRNFHQCSVAVRTGVFYDLLVNLLTDFPERQTEITQWSEFIALPKKEQAHLFRLMASRTLVFGKEQPHVKNWLYQSRRLHPPDIASAMLWLLFHIHPGLAKSVLKLKTDYQVDPRLIPPFADMKIGDGS
jgi:glycosyltransferase involved in cell wall biosynthesis